MVFVVSLPCVPIPFSLFVTALCFDLGWGLGQGKGRHGHTQTHIIQDDQTAPRMSGTPQRQKAIPPRDIPEAPSAADLRPSPSSVGSFRPASDMALVTD